MATTTNKPRKPRKGSKAYTGPTVSYLYPYEVGTWRIRFAYSKVESIVTVFLNRRKGYLAYTTPNNNPNALQYTDVVTLLGRITHCEKIA